MLRIEGKQRGRVVATLLAIAAVLVTWVIAPATTSAAQGTTAQWTVTGPQGGPFAPASSSIDITNGWGKKLRWYAIGDTSWVRISGFNGVIKPGQTKTLHVELVDKAAASLPKGDYKCQIAFRDPSNGQFASAADLILIVGDPPPPPPTAGRLVVTPPEGLTTSGNLGGSFSPLAKTYTLSNPGTTPVDWKVTFDSDWVSTPDPTTGQLQPGASQGLQVRLDASLLAKFPVGQQTAQVRFHDTGSGQQVTSRPVVVNVKSSSSSSGWTEFKKSADTRVVYVSSSQGNDANDGLSEATPKKTIGAGKALLRNGFPDWLLLKKGDSWNEDLGTWTRSGRSASEPMLITSYGSGARPHLRCPGNGLAAFNGAPVDIAVVDLHFEPASTPTDSDGIAWYTGGGRLLVEGCLFEKFDIGIHFESGSDFTIRRNVVVDCTGHGVYSWGVSGCTIEENVFDTLGHPNPDIFKHGLYIHQGNKSGFVLRGNIMANTSSHGAQLRTGGVAEDNLFVRTPIGLLLGGSESWNNPQGGVLAEVRRNVFLEGTNINPSTHRGWGLVLENVISGMVEDNIIANAPDAGYPLPITLGANDTKAMYGITVRRNTISGWGGNSVIIKGSSSSILKDLVLEQNQVQNAVDASYLVEVSDAAFYSEITSQSNQFFSGPMASNNWFLLGGSNTSLNGYKSTLGDTTSVAKQVSYPNAGASIAGYQASLGKTASTQAFLTEARKQSKDYWRTEYTAAGVNAWVRAAFGK